MSKDSEDGRTGIMGVVFTVEHLECFSKELAAIEAELDATRDQRMRDIARPLARKDIEVLMSILTKDMSKE